MEKNLVTSLELSKTLEKLGVKQESLFYWCKTMSGARLCFETEIGTFSVIDSLGAAISKKSILASAFLSGELGEMLPKGEYLETFFHSLEIQLKITIQGCSKVFQGDTEANARAKMLIYLKENKLI